jgi:hypothetical protein
MPYYYDEYGWLTETVVADRATELLPPSASSGFMPNFTAGAWVILPYLPLQPAATQPRWTPTAVVLRRFLDQEWQAINGRLATDPTLAILKDKFMAGSVENPGFINLDAAELADGLDYLVQLDILTTARKAAILA